MTKTRFEEVVAEKGEDPYCMCCDYNVEELEEDVRKVGFKEALRILERLSRSLVHDEDGQDTLEGFVKEFVRDKLGSVSGVDELVEMYGTLHGSHATRENPKFPDFWAL